MAIKDEYEVARLYTDGKFAKAIAQQFKGDYKLTFHLAPPILGRRDEFTGKPLKTEFGPWMMTAMRVLASLKGLRGRGFDIFGRSAERKAERQLLADYRATIEHLLPNISEASEEAAIAIASLPETIRGFGHVKEDSIARARARETELLSAFDKTAVRDMKAAAE